MKLQFKYQKFQADAAKAVVDVFAGQKFAEKNYSIDTGADNLLYELGGIANYPIELSEEKILSNLQKVQRANNIEPSKDLKKIDGGYNLTVEMETGVGKTYTYIKTMYELNKNFGWSKFIIVVPSIAIREGVYKTFQITEDHFAEEYGQKIKYFIYNSARLTEIEHFAEDNFINVMIINSQAFNAKGSDARRIRMELDEFRSRRPIDIIAQTNPILIIDEPQSVEGTKTKESLKEFKPILTLRYSATHREIYNMVYRLDAMDAYNKHLVKKISVTGIKISAMTAAESFMYLERINLSKGTPSATIQIDCKGNETIRKAVRKIKIGDNLFELSNGLDEYKNNFVVKNIDGRDNSVEFLNGKKIFVGDAVGNMNEEQLRKIQIRETIKAHLQKESQLFGKGIKVLSLFFIDEVAHYKIYDSAGNAQNGDFAKWFEEEYSEAVKEFQQELFNDEYKKYLAAIPVEKTHAGYFSIDNKGKMTNSKLSNRKENLSDDIDAYNLIMKNKELLLDQNPQNSPVRFIFSHSALREGWDNPNVFQICTLKQSSSDIRKRQEVGRGLRLCVNKFGTRMDENILGNEVHKINLLTVIAGESYEDFTRKLQSEIAEAVSDRPRIVTPKLFTDNKIDESLAIKIYNSMVRNNYVDDDGFLTDKYEEDKKNFALKLPEEIAECKDDVFKTLDKVYSAKNYQIEDAKKNNITVQLDRKKFNSPEFKNLWEKINSKTIYQVNFDTDELAQNSATALNEKLTVTKIYFRIEDGELSKIKSKNDLLEGTAFEKISADNSRAKIIDAISEIEYDIVGKLMNETGLMRGTVTKILSAVDKNIFAQFQDNPEEFILTAGKIIESVKAASIIKNIKYILTGEVFPATIFEDSNITGVLNLNAVETNKNLYNYLIYDSTVEKNFARELEADKNVSVYVKLPSEFYIATPVGKYNPDWAIVFRGSDKIYFVIETKGSTDILQLREVERDKIHCAKEYFKTVDAENIYYDVVSSFEELLNKIMRQDK